jgi:hypothetical protein
LLLINQTHLIRLPHKSQVLQLLALLLSQLARLCCFADAADPARQLPSIRSSARHVAAAMLLLPGGQLLQP